MVNLSSGDILPLLFRRCMDMAATCNFSKKAASPLKVYYNGNRLPVHDFKKYAQLHVLESQTVVYERVNEFWEIALANNSSSGAMRQVSFVNSINTSKGGSHVDYVADQVCDFLFEYMEKKHKTTIKMQTLRNHLFVFVNCLIVNPAFETQTKTSLKMNRNTFGSKCELSGTFLKKLVDKTTLVQDLLLIAQFQMQKDVKKADGKKCRRLVGIPKLDDANEAGGRNSQDCTLILTEGDSAKALAVAGLSVIGRDKYGVFPLKGKFINVRGMDALSALNNEELRNLIDILGLKFGTKYHSTSELRYGHVMIMTDMDHDGSHIKGLIINLFACWWPELLKLERFMQEFLTPCVKLSKGQALIRFYSDEEYEQWLEANKQGQGWNIKWLKGLGSSSSQEAIEYFRDLPKHVRSFVWKGEACFTALELMFHPSNSNRRKQWLEQDNPVGAIHDASYYHFVHTELKKHAIATNRRCIPNVIDGLKPSQRKILFVCFLRKLHTEIKVAQLGGAIAERSAYHHGEKSLMSAIVNMAQDFLGSNNINLLEPNGQFGTRLTGGNDAASPRYIFTQLSKITRLIFPEVDDALYSHEYDDGLQVEPEFYAPIIPMVFANGASGIGEGYSCSVPSYRPARLGAAFVA